MKLLINIIVSTVLQNLPLFFPLRKDANLESLILITKPVGPNKEVLIFEWDQKQDKPVS